MENDDSEKEKEKEKKTTYKLRMRLPSSENGAYEMRHLAGSIP
jgi:hypothetical protein